MKRKKVYISGPMRGVEDMNREAFDLIARTLNRLDFEAVNPHRFNVSTTSGDILLTDEEWIEVDILALKHCDAIFMLPGWQDSAGASLEWGDAVELGIPAYGFDLEG